MMKRWTIGGALTGATLALLAVSFWIYLGRTGSGTSGPVYDGYRLIETFRVLVWVSSPWAMAGGIVGYFVGRSPMTRWWTIGGALAGATSAFLAMIFWFYLERSDFGSKEPVYGGYWSIAAFGVLVFISPPGAAVGGIVGYFVRRRLGRSG